MKDAGIHARVINIHTIKPLDKELVIKAAKETGRIITAEEHNIIGGLGEAYGKPMSIRKYSNYRAWRQNRHSYSSDG